MARTFLTPTIPQVETNTPQVNIIKQYRAYFDGFIEPLKKLFHSHSFIRYSILGILVLFLSGYISLSTLSSRNIRSQTTKNTITGRVLTFQGSLTDKLGNPITSKTDLTFRLYTKEVGGTAIYTGKCIGETALTPDIHGIFSTTVGGDCGMKKIPSDVFTDNPNLYLGVSVGSDPEMRPRQKIANVGTAASADSLSGLAVGTDINTIPYINYEGTLEIAAASPTIESTSGMLTLKGTALTLSTSSLDGDIHFSPRGGNVFINGNLGIGSSLPPTFKLELTGDLGPSLGYVYNIGSPLKQFASIYGETLYQNNYQVCDTSGNCGSVNSWTNLNDNVYLTTPTDKVGIGTEAPSHKLSIEGSVAGKALVSLWEKGDQDILVASRSSSVASTVFKITNTGNIRQAAGTRWMPLTDSINALNIAGTNDIPFVTFDTSNRRVGIGSTLTANGILHVAGANQGKALVMLDEIGDQNILVASASGSTKFVFNRSGNIAIGQGTIDANRQIDTSSGAFLSSSGTWTDASSRDWKHNFRSLDYSEILNKVKNLSVTQWSYKSDSDTIKHIGPVAEDFFASFGIGHDNKHIAALDTAGIALASVKGLAIENETLNRQIADLNEKQNTNDRKLEQASGLMNNLLESNKEELQSSVENIYYGLLKQAKYTPLEYLEELAEISLKSLKTTALTAENAIVKNTLDVKNVTSDYLSALGSHIDRLTADFISVRAKISSPVVETRDVIASGEAKIGVLKTNQITTDSDNLTIDLNSSDMNKNTNKATNVENRGSLAKLIIKGLDGKVISSIDELGNATFSGVLEANSVRTNDIYSNSINSQTATLSGSLIARTIKSDNIDALENVVANNSQSLTNQALHLENLNNSINEVQRLLGEMRNQPVNSENYQNLMQALTLSLSNVIDPHNSSNGTNVGQKLVSIDDLTVLGSANIYKAGITDSLTVGNVFVRDNSILSLSWDLNISALSNINFFGGIISLHKDGSFISKGQVIAQGGIRTNKLSTIGEDEDFAIQLRNNPAAISQPKLSIQDGTSTEVASINTMGEARFKSLALDKYKPKSNTTVISATDNFSVNGEYTPALETDSYAAGEGLLPAHNAEVIIYNDRVKEDSLVYLTSTSTNSSVSLSISEKKTCLTGQTSCRPYFKVRSNVLSTTPTTFNWLLVN